MRSDFPRPKRLLGTIEQLKMDNLPEPTSLAGPGSQLFSPKNWWHGSRFNQVVWRLIREEIEAAKHRIYIPADPALAYYAINGAAIHGELIQVEPEIGG